MKEQHQAVCDPLARPDDEDVQVHGDGHGPEETAGVRESGYGSLSDALGRVGAENAPDSEGVGDGRQPVGHREEHQQPPRGGPQVRPDNVCEDDQRGAQEGQSAGTQHHHLLGQIQLRLIPAGHRLQ